MIWPVPMRSACPQMCIACRRTVNEKARILTAPQITGGPLKTDVSRFQTYLISKLSIYIDDNLPLCPYLCFYIIEDASIQTWRVERNGIKGIIYRFQRLPGPVCSFHRSHSITGNVHQTRFGLRFHSRRLDAYFKIRVEKVFKISDYAREMCLCSCVWASVPKSCFYCSQLSMITIPDDTR